MKKRLHGQNHPQCNICWFEEFGISQHPFRVLRPVIEACCFCGRPTESGIYRKVAPTAPSPPQCQERLTRQDRRNAVAPAAPTG